MPIGIVLLVFACIALWVAMSFGLVLLLGGLYTRFVDRLMRERRLVAAAGGAVASPVPGGPRPAIVSRELDVRGRDKHNPFRRRHRGRLAIYVAASAVYGFSYGLISIVSIAAKDGTLARLPTFLTSPEVMWLACRYAAVPAVATLIVLRVRRLQHQASGIWVASLIMVALPFGKVNLHLRDTSIVRVLVFMVLGVVAAFAYLRLNAWRARHSPWSLQARGLNSFYLAFGAYALLFDAVDHRLLKGLTYFVVPYALYALTLRVLFRFVRLGPIKRLLFLRVFGRGAQTDRFYRALVWDWSTLGPVRLIGAPDLARRTLSPHLLAAFAAGSLRRVFDWDERELERRLDEAEKPLIDKLYRTVEVLCAGDTWQTAVRRLSRDADVVVMDLRGFTRANRGCAWELGELANQVSLARVLLCIDGRTDRAALAEALGAAWEGVALASPNRDASEPFQLLDVGSDANVASAFAARLAFGNDDGLRVASPGTQR